MCVCVCVCVRVFERERERVERERERERGGKKREVVCFCEREGVEYEIKWVNI